MFSTTSTDYRPVLALPVQAGKAWAITYQEYDPPASLRPFVSCFWQMGSEEPIGAAVTHRVVPDGSTDLVFDLGSPDAHTAAAVVGVTTRPLVVSLHGRVDYFAVRFRPGALPHFVPCWADGLIDQLVPLASVAQESVGRLTAQLRTTADPHERTALLAAYLEQHFHNPRGNDLCPETLRHILQCHGAVTVPELADRSSMSERQFRRVFGQWFGVGPKAFCRIMRFQSLLRLIKRNPGGLLHTVLAGGYHDQAHFIHEFRGFTGLSPTAFARTVAVF